MNQVAQKSMTARRLALALAAACALGFAGQSLAGPQAVAAGDKAVYEAANARVAAAAAISRRLQRSESLSESSRLSLHQALLGASDAGLDAARTAGSYKQAMVSIRSTSGLQNKVLGDLERDLVFYPIAPCRLLDTRVPPGTALAGGVPLGVDFDGGNPGNAAGCTFSGVLSQLVSITGLTRTALAINITVVSPAGGGNLAARPVGSTNVTASLVFQLGVNESNMAIVQDSGTSIEFELVASTTTHAVVDVLGVFAPPLATALECETLESASTPFAAGATVSLDAPACSAGFTATGPMLRNTSTFSNLFVINNVFPVNDTFRCQGSNGTAGSVNFQCGVKCCRVPGR